MKVIKVLTAHSRLMIVLMLISGLLLLDCSKIRTLYSPTELDTEKSYITLINKKVRVHLHDNKMIEGYLVAVGNDSISIDPKKLATSMRIARQDVNHIEVFEADHSVLVAGGIVLVCIILFYCVKGLAAGIESAGI